MKKIVAAVLAVALVLSFSSLDHTESADPGTGGLTPNSIVLTEEI